MKRVTLLLLISALLIPPVTALAQTERIEFELDYTLGPAVSPGQKIDARFSGYAAYHVGRLRLGYGARDVAPAYALRQGMTVDTTTPSHGPVIAIETGKWNFYKQMTVTLEALGYSDISGSFDFKNFIVGANSVWDIWPDNPFYGVLGVSWWEEGPGKPQSKLLTFGIRARLE